MSNIIFEWLISFRWSVFSFVNIIINENANILKWFNGTGSNMLTNILKLNQLPNNIKNAKDVRLYFHNYSTIIFIIFLYRFENHRRNDNFLFSIQAIFQVVIFLFLEFTKSNHDDQPVGGAVLVRLQNEVGPRRVRRGRHAPRPIGPHLEARHCPLQQVKYFKWKCNG